MPSEHRNHLIITGQYQVDLFTLDQSADMELEEETGLVDNDQVQVRTR